MAKVMLVEDDNNLREIYEARLQAEGYTIVSAHDGEEALVVAKAEHPDLIISDVMMPKISGFEMLDILRNTDGLKDVKVIMLTALGQSDDQQRADRLGANRYLVKSQVTLEDIVKVAQDLLADDGATPVTAPAADPAVPAPAAADAPVVDTPVVAPPSSEAPAPDAPDGNSKLVQSLEVTSTPVSAQSTAEEAAQLETQIEGFAAAVPATAPTEAAPDAMAPAEITVATPLPDLTVVAPPTANDEVMADALERLAGTPPATEPTAESSPGPTPEATPEAGGASDAPTHSKRIIAPLDGADGPTKPDLNALLALEEAKEAAATPGASYPPVSNTPTATPATAPTPPATPPTPGSGGVDPNSIAL